MTDFLIIGQGIAGSLLARELVNRGKSVVMIDDDNRQSSSAVAAGIMSPVNGKRMTILDDFERIFSRAVALYAEFESQFGEKFFEPKPILRIFQNEEEHGYWLKTLERNPNQKFVQMMKGPDALSPEINDAYGSILIESSGFCRSRPLISALKKHFQERNILQIRKFSYENLKIESDQAVYLGEKYSKVIFCEGYQAQFNPWFSWIPFQNVKGEILKVAFDQTDLPDAIINRGKWAVPLGSGEWMAGANYIWDRIDCEPTQDGREEILNGLQKCFDRTMNVIQHQAGVRPATTDQKPVLGLHPEIPALGIFNGFGSKGFLLTPTYAPMFADFLCGHGKIDEAVALKRYLDKMKEV